MAATVRRSLQEYLALEYPFNVIADPDGGYVVEFPDLSGCMTQVDSLSELASMAEDARTLWLETAYAEGLDIPLPSYPEEYSGKFNLRLPRSVHRKLAEAADRDGTSLNSYVCEVLARGDAQLLVERRLQELETRMGERLAEIDEHLGAIRASMRYQPTGVPQPSQEHRPFEIVRDAGEEGYERSVAA